MSGRLNPVKSVMEELRILLADTLDGLAARGEVPAVPVPPFVIEIPAGASHGDFASNIAMVCAKPFAKPPREIAALICGAISLGSGSFDKAETAGPGFINFFLSKKWFSETVRGINEAGECYGGTDFGKGKRVIVEFVSANPTGPMHIGNARGGALGDCLSSVLQTAGYDVWREFYVNDAGNQIEKFADSLEARYLQVFDGNIEMPENSYLGEDIIEHAKAFADIYGDKYISAVPLERRAALINYALPKNIEKLESDLLKYRIVYDRWFRESSLHENGSVDEIITLLKKSGHTFEQDGALWFKASAFGDEKDRVLVRQNGIPTYFVPDIAYHYDKLVKRGYDIAVDVLGADHHGYILRMKAALQALDVDPDRLKAIIMQMVRLVKDGEAYKLSKRSGRAVTLETLLDEIPVDAARFFFNLREANSHFELDLDLAIEQSSKNPVYYVSYAHARICSILRRMEEEEGVVANSQFGILHSGSFSEPEELALIRHLAAFPNVVDSAAAALDPSPVTRYSVELASLFHKFYDKCRVNCPNASLMQARIALCLAVKNTLKSVFNMMKLNCPEHM